MMKGRSLEVVRLSVAQVVGVEDGAVVEDGLARFSSIVAVELGQHPRVHCP